MAIVHLVCGPIGAGKTTRSMELARTLPGIRFSLDEWIINLYGNERPEPMHLEWWAERAARSSSQIWQVCRQLLALNTDVILDFGFGARSQRHHYQTLAREVGAITKLHVVTTDIAERRRRVRLRNNEKAEAFALTITDAMFDASETWWEPPTPNELNEIETVIP